MKDDYYPQEISQKESALGFRLLLIEGIGALMGSQIRPVPVPVVACVLSSSDVLVKIRAENGRVAYSHRRFGCSKRTPYRRRPEWSPVSLPVSNAQKLISDFKSNIHTENFPQSVNPFPFKFKEAEGDVSSGPSAN
jgi:hypothetical protein